MASKSEISALCEFFQGLRQSGVVVDVASLLARAKILSEMHLWPVKRSNEKYIGLFWKYWVSEQLNALFIPLRDMLNKDIPFGNVKCILGISHDWDDRCTNQDVLNESIKLVEYFEENIKDKWMESIDSINSINFETNLNYKDFENERVILKILVSRLYYVRGYYSYKDCTTGEDKRIPDYDSAVIALKQSLEYFPLPDSGLQLCHVYIKGKTLDTKEELSALIPPILSKISTQSKNELLYTKEKIGLLQKQINQYSNHQVNAKRFASRNSTDCIIL